MNNKRLLVLCASLALTVSASIGGNATAKDIYKWVDEQGNVHYGDRPAGNEDAEVVPLTYQRADAAAAKRGNESQAELTSSLKERRAAREEEKKTAAEAAAAAEAKQKKCQTYRARLETFVQSRRLYREDENGERIYLDEDQRSAARQKVEELIAENCT